MTAKELKASILDLAVRGKLVPQDPNDEPASVLLQKIRAEKQKLVKGSSIRTASAFALTISVCTAPSMRWNTARRPCVPKPSAGSIPSCASRSSQVLTWHPLSAKSEAGAADGGVRQYATIEAALQPGGTDGAYALYRLASLPHLGQALIW